MAPGHAKWKGLYEFDTPVIHVDNTAQLQGEETTAAARKLMHRLKEAEVEKLMDEVESDKSA